MPITSVNGVEKSWELRDRALELIPLATQTHSKAVKEALRGIEPCYIVRGQGCRVWDLDGNKYIDFRNGCGPISLGYWYPAVEEALRRQLESGYIFSYPHPLEVEVAERLVKIIPCSERVRYLKTGGEAMAAAHRLARGFTERDLVFTCGYHGWINTMSRKGVPEATRSTYGSIGWGDIEGAVRAFEEHPDQIAAVSVSCGYADMERGREFLPALRTLTEKYGALLIFDEIVTGFRVSRGGAQEYFGVTPDLAAFAKAISNGVPLSCYTGRADVMEKVQETTISSTFGGDTLGLAAAKAVLDIYENEDVVGTLWERGKQLHEGFAAHCERLGVPAGFKGLPPLGQFSFHHPNAKRNGELFVRFSGEVMKRGLIIYTVFYVNYSHSEADIDEALVAMGESLEVMKEEGAFD